MKLRRLEKRDAPFMLEWMHDHDIVKDLSASFSEKNIDDCESFIKGSLNGSGELHLAVTDENDTYMGTVSLKKIDREYSDAEFGIAVRKCAMGRGFSSYAIKQILRIGFEDLDLQTIYWCVARENRRAVKFYDKMGYTQLEEPTARMKRNYLEKQGLLWYVVKRPSGFTL